MRIAGRFMKFHGRACADSIEGPAPSRLAELTIGFVEGTHDVPIFPEIGKTSATVNKNTRCEEIRTSPTGHQAFWYFYEMLCVSVAET